MLFGWFVNYRGAAQAGLFACEKRTDFFWKGLCVGAAGMGVTDLTCGNYQRFAACLSRSTIHTSTDPTQDGVLWANQLRAGHREVPRCCEVRVQLLQEGGAFSHQHHGLGER